MRIIIKTRFPKHTLSLLKISYHNNSYHDDPPRSIISFVASIIAKFQGSTLAVIKSSVTTSSKPFSDFVPLQTQD